MRRRLIGILTVVLLAASVLAACGGNGNSGNSGNAGNGGEGANAPTAETGGTTDLEPVTLTWYYPLSQLQADQTKVEEAVNKITKEKLNATVKMMPIAIGDYVQKMNTVLAAGEEV